LPRTRGRIAFEGPFGLRPSCQNIPSRTAGARLNGLSVSFSIGTATASLVHPREVFQPALLLGACALIVAHSPPFGDPSRSVEDRDVKKRLARAGKLLGITLLDSIVWTHEGTFASLRGLSPDLL